MPAKPHFLKRKESYSKTESVTHQCKMAVGIGVSNIYWSHTNSTGLVDEPAELEMSIESPWSTIFAESNCFHANKGKSLYEMYSKTTLDPLRSNICCIKHVQENPLA